jgi:hypothetical protein
MWVYIIVVLTSLSSPSVKIAAGGAGGRAPDLRGPELLGNEVDDALLGSEKCCRTSPRIGPNRKGIAHTRERASIEPRRDVRERSIRVSFDPTYANVRTERIRTHSRATHSLLETAEPDTQ